MWRRKASAFIILRLRDAAPCVCLCVDGLAVVSTNRKFVAGALLRVVAC